MAKRSKASTTRSALEKIIDLLRAQHGPVDSAAPKDPFALLLWEYVAYLADDDARLRAFRKLEATIGVTPVAVAAASRPALESACRAGGAIAFKLRAERMHVIARFVLETFAGQLESVLTLPYVESRRILKSFPAIGPPGADKILLLSGAQAVLALDSNALRVLLRLGYGAASSSYATSYKSAQEAAVGELHPTPRALRDASLLLRHHGVEICRRNAPRCSSCAAETRCAFARGSLSKTGRPIT